MGPEQYTPNLPWQHLLPVIIVLGGAAIGVLLEAFVSRKARWATQAIYTPIVILGAGAALINSAAEQLALKKPSTMGGNDLVLDNFTIGSQVVVLILGLLAIVVMIDRTVIKDGAFAGQPSDRPGSYEEELTERHAYQRSEIFPLALFSLGGMMLFPMCLSFITMFIALEIISLPMYVLAATARRRRLLSQEAALKYFILGAFSSAFFLMGIALLYGYSGQLNLYAVGYTVSQGHGTPYLLLPGVVLVLVGLLFKVGAAPFHAWTPDVYQGAPTPVTGYMAAGVKAAAFLALARFYHTLAGQLMGNILVFVLIVIVLTIVVGTYFGLVQDNIKRMLAYSSIAHAGFILMGIVSIARDLSAMGVMFYVLVYGIATIGAFGVIYLVRSVSEDGTILGEAHSIKAWKGLGKTSPLLAGSMMIFLLSFAGIPLTSGFVGKFLVFSSALQGGMPVLVFVGVVASAITAFYYFRLGAYMFLEEPDGNTAEVTSAGPAIAIIVICAVATIVLGIFPGLFINFPLAGLY